MASSPNVNANNMQNEWARMLYQDGYLDVLKLFAFEGEVKRKSNIRSVCWKLFLEVLPEDRSLWVEYSKKSREEYERLKKKFIIDPHDAQASVDLTKNNPLSQEKESPWHQFFQDGELKRIIETDVVRTFPEQMYFKEEHVRESMMNVLFCYGKEHPDTSYRQGMHELLAPLMFVLQSGQLDEEQLQTLPVELSVVLDPQYLEHDAFAMFSVLMDTMQGWYHLGSHSERKVQPTHKFDSIHRRPFDGGRHMSSLPNVSYKLAKIHSLLLKRFDPEVHQRLVELDVAPEVYGIRWIRLLFSREFPFLSTLDLWDAIFADGKTLEIVDYIYVAMLSNIRGQLLYQGNGYTQCMSLLMNYPDQMEVQAIVQRARHMRYPKLVPAPDVVDGPTVKPPESQLTSREDSKSKDPIVKKLQEVQKRVKNTDWGGVAGRLSQELSKKPHSSPRPAARSRSHYNKPSEKVVIAKSHPETVVPVALAIDQDNKIDAIAETVGEELALNPHQNRARPHSGSSVKHLEQRLDDLETLRKYCGSKMDTQLDILQHAVYAMELNVEESGDIYSALAELKQVRDLLLGQLSFSGAIVDLSAPLTSDGPAHSKTHSGEGDTQEVGHVTGSYEVAMGHTESTSEPGLPPPSDDDVISSPAHSHQCETQPALDGAPPIPSAEACPLPPPTPTGATEEHPSSVHSSELEEVEGELQDADLLSDYTVLSLAPSAVGMGEERSCDSHVTGGTETQ